MSEYPFIIIKRKESPYYYLQFNNNYIYEHKRFREEHTNPDSAIAKFCKCIFE